jgi:hypothetical protein
MLDTGFPRADVENEFLRARRHQVLATLTRHLRHQPHDGDRLLRLDDFTGALGWRGERHLGLQTIRLDTIVGTAGSRRDFDFDRHFRPTSNRVRSRWEQLALAERRGAAIPPIEVYRIDGLHFVSDGHHRVSIAAATRRQTIDAYVTEILTSVPPHGTTRAPAARLASDRHAGPKRRPCRQQRPAGQRAIRALPAEAPEGEGRGQPVSGQRYRDRQVGGRIAGADGSPGAPAALTAR